MEPTIKEGQVLWVNQWAFFFQSPKVGDVVLFRKNNQELVKRIEKIVAEKIYLVGDNPSDSFDSRSFGPIERIDLIGKINI